VWAVHHRIARQRNRTYTTRDLFFFRERSSCLAGRDFGLTLRASIVVQSCSADATRDPFSSSVNLQEHDGEYH
jgi:hypothetical protein